MDDKTPIVNESCRATVWQLFSTFLKIGAFTIGGGYAMIPLIEREVVQNRKWLSEEDFVELLALAQAAPGVIAMNIAVFVGYKSLGIKGVFAATIGSVLPSFLIILAIATVFTDFKENPVVESIFKGVRPAVAALIAVPIIKMVRTVHLTWKTALIPVAAVALIYFAHLNPVWTILMAATGGILWSWLRKS
ncbi:MAG: chromate transporter [Bacteroidales bacterium]|nr:chromate transporter [Bacteroidales bacterium]